MYYYTAGKIVLWGQSNNKTLFSKNNGKLLALNVVLSFISIIDSSTIIKLTRQVPHFIRGLTTKMTE